MQDLEDLIRQAGLKEIKRYETAKDTNLVEANYYLSGQNIAKYLFIECNLTFLLNLSRDQDTFQRFQAKYVENIYFTDISGDLRWSLYLVFVIPNSDYGKIPKKHLYLIERDKKYARKLVVRQSDFLTRIPVSKISNKIQQQQISDPLEDWYGIMEEKGLNFCLDKFKKENVRQYLSGQSVDPSVQIYSSSDFLNIPSIEPSGFHILSLETGTEFRPYCFGKNKTINFSKVNLLEGANGAGKTTILEAIEFAMTGKNQRYLLGNARKDINNEPKWNGRLVFTNGQIYDYSPSPAERKNREAKFYRNREKRVDKLNQTFHQYNYFSSEDAFRFSFTEDGQPDYRNEFGRIIFGEELGSIGKNIQAYQHEFDIQLKNLEKEMLDNRDLIVKLESEELHEGVNSISFTLLDKLIFESRVEFPKRLNDTDLEQLLSWVKNLHLHLIHLETLSGPIEKMFEAGLYTLAQLRSDLTSKKVIQDELQIEWKEIHQHIEESEKKTKEYEEQIKGITESNAHQIKNIGVLEQLHEDLTRFEHIYKQEKKVIQRERLEEDYKIFTNQINTCEFFMKNWGDFKILSLPKTDTTRLKEKRNFLNSNINEVDVKIALLKNSIQNHKRSQKEKEELFLNLKSLGSKYLLSHPDSLSCPLCHADYASSQLLKEAIMADLVEVYPEFVKLQEELNDLLEESNHLIVEQREINEELGIWKRFDEAISFLRRANSFEDKIEQSNTKYPLQLYKKVAEELDLLQQRLENCEQEIVALELEGFSLKNISQARELLTGHPFLKPVHQNGSTLSYVEVIRLIQDGLYKYKENSENFMAERTSCEIFLHIEKKRVIELRENLRVVKKDHEKTSKQISLYKEWVSIINKLSENGVSLDDNQSYVEFRSYLSRMLEETLEVTASIEVKTSTNNRLELINQYKNVFSIHQQEYERCELAIKTLQNLKPLSQYSEEFLMEHITEISDLFTALHLPREFEGLDLDSQGKIVAYREEDDRRVEIPVYQLSTGQRTAVALSVFFTLHLSMDTVPNFILLDEPVANMDDMNVLGLFDFLRELVIKRNTQLIFTTANATVAGLFQRKFNFLQEGVRNFKFSRIGEETDISISLLSN